MALFAAAHMQDIVALLAPVSLFAVLYAHLHRVSLPTRPPAEAVVLGLLVVYLGINVVLHRSLEGISPVAFFRSYGRIFYVLAIFGVFLLRRPDDHTERALYPAAFWVAVAIASISLYSWFVTPLSIGSVTVTGDRLNGLLGGHNPTAGSLGAILLLFLVAVLHRREEGAPFRVRGVHWIGALLIFVAILLTKSRGYMLGLFAITPLLVAPALWRGIRRYRLPLRAVGAAILVVVGVGVAGVVLASRLRADVLSDPTLLVRFALFARAWEFGTESALFGLGLGTFQQTNVTFNSIVPGLAAVRESGDYLSEIVPMTVDGGLHAHNVFLQLFAEIGLVGIGLLGLLFFLVLRRVRKLPSPSRDARLPASPEASSEGREGSRDRFLGATARFNGRLAGYLLAFGAVAGLTSGYTLFSPSTAWLLYVACARTARQHERLAADAMERVPGRMSARPLRPSLGLADGRTP